MNNNKISCADFLDILKKDFSYFSISDEELLYIVAGDFARYLFESYQNDNLGELQKGLDFIEKLLQQGDEEIKTLAVIGIIEDIQNIGSHSNIDFSKLFLLLGNESKKSWIDVNNFWGN